MNLKKFKIGILAIILILVITLVSLGIYTYRGSYLGEESSPNKAYSLRYYSTINPLKMFWSMPGGSSCKPRWIRLYDKSGAKLNELYTTDCALEMPINWLDKELILPDGNTIWNLPGSGGQGIR